MSLFENFPFTNLHQLNLNWLIEEVKKCYSPDNPPEAMVISVNGESGVVTLYRDAHVNLPDITEEQWNIYRGSANKITGIEFNKDNPATRINGNQRFVIYDAGNPPPYPVIAVNGETGNVILYEEPYVVFPDIEGDNWGLERKLNTDTADETRVGIMFDDTGKAYITHDEDATQLLTIEDIPTSSGVVSFNGQTGILIITGSDINKSATDNRSINAAIDTNTNAINDNITAINANTNAINANKGLMGYYEPTNTAQHNIPVDSWIFWNNGIYKATQAISINDTLSTNNLTNISNGALNNIEEKLDRIEGLKTGVNYIGNIFCAGYNTGSGNYIDVFVPINTNGRTVLSASALEGSIAFNPSGKVDFSVPPTISVLEYTNFGIRLEIAYPSTQNSNISATMYLLGLTVTCS